MILQFLRTGSVLVITTAVVVACGSSASTGATGTSGGSGIACDAAATSTCGSRKCDTVLGCVECLTDPDCGAGEPFCFGGKCAACRTNSDCGVSAPACYPKDGKCHAACTATTGCDADQKQCDVASGVCFGCRSNADCAAPKAVCNTTRAQCTECASNADCPASAPRCAGAEGKCAQCLSNADCGAAAPVCDLDDFKCKVTTAKK